MVLALYGVGIGSGTHWGGGGGGWGGGTASLKVGTHCQTTAPAFWSCPTLTALQKKAFSIETYLEKSSKVFCKAFSTKNVMYFVN